MDLFQLIFEALLKIFVAANQLVENLLTNEQLVAYLNKKKQKKIVLKKLY